MTLAAPAARSWVQRTLLLVAVTLGACGDGDELAAAKVDCMAKDIEIEPCTAAPGATLTMHFPTDAMRGRVYALRDVDAPDEVVVWLLSSRPGGSSEPTSTKTRPDTVGIGLNGPGPELVRLPDDLPSGVYRLCIDGPADAPCVEIEVRNET